MIAFYCKRRKAEVTSEECFRECFPLYKEAGNAPYPTRALCVMHNQDKGTVRQVTEELKKSESLKPIIEEAIMATKSKSAQKKSFKKSTSKASPKSSPAPKPATPSPEKKEEIKKPFQPSQPKTLSESIKPKVKKEPKPSPYAHAARLLLERKYTDDVILEMTKKAMPETRFEVSMISAIRSCLNKGPEYRGIKAPAKPVERIEPKTSETK